MRMRSQLDCTYSGKCIYNSQLDKGRFQRFIENSNSSIYYECESIENISIYWLRAQCEG